MTREEAIDKLQWLWHEVYNEDCDGSDYAEAIDMAISALIEAENGCDGCLYEVSDGSLFPCNICRLNYGCKYEKDDSNNITESPNEVDEKNDDVINRLEVQNYHIKTQNIDKSESYADDLISRAKAIESAEVYCATDGAYGYMDIKSIVEMLESIPSVSAERVVRCKDCEYNENGTCFVLMCVSFDDFFCGYAKMKGGNE